MVCSQCGFEKGKNKTFCTECGAKLKTTCPICSAPIDGPEKFCGQCGYNLIAEAPPPENGSTVTTQNLQQYLPKKLVEKISNQWQRIEGEKRLVTFLICDISGVPHKKQIYNFSDGATAYDQIKNIVLRKINDYKGTVNDFSNSQITGFYGAPLIIEDAPLRAVRSAWAIHREIHKLSQEVSQDIKSPPLFDVKIGIHTDSVTLKTLAPDIRVELEEASAIDIALGTVKLSGAGDTCISETTYHYAEGFFKFEDIGSQKAEGYEKDIRIFKMVNLNCAESYLKECSQENISYLNGDEHTDTSPDNIPHASKDNKSGPEYRSRHLWSTPWKTAEPENNGSLHIKRKFPIFLSLFYLILIIFMIGEYFYPEGPLTRITRIFHNFWANAIITTSFLLVLSFILYWLFSLIYTNLIKGWIQKPKLGEMLLNEGYISDDDLAEALAIQDLRLGEILVESGDLTREQLNQALDYQKQTSGKLGQILIKLGFLTDREIELALSKLNRRLGNILRDKGLLSDYNLYWILRRQLHGENQMKKH